MPDSPFTYRVANASEILMLRHAVLRPGRPIDAARYVEDDDPATIHIGAFDANETVGCATVLQKSFSDEPAWQLRGMATAPRVVRQGVGAGVIRCMIETLASRNGQSLIWCNARLVAIDFYRKQGFRAESGTYLVPDVGPHVRMSYRIV